MINQLTNLARKSCLLGLFLAGVGVSLVYAQQTATGQITNETGAAIPEANVLIQRTTVGSVADIEGNYCIAASSDDMLTFSFVGYLT